MAKRIDIHSHFDVEDLGWLTPCHIWRGCQSSGYAHIRRDGKSQLVHRYLYIERNGDVPDDLDIDHLCNVSLCINVDHLEAITHKENVRRHHERERQEWDELLTELRRVGDDQSLKLVQRVSRRRELTLMRSRKWQQYNNPEQSEV